MEERIILDKGWTLSTPEGDISLDISHMPAQVHDILFEAGRIGEEYRRGRLDSSGWVSGRKWIYENKLQIPEGEEDRQISLNKSEAKRS